MGFSIEIVLAVLTTLAAQAGVPVGPPLHTFTTIKADDVGQKLQSSMIWANPSEDGEGVAIVFRKTIDLPVKPSRAILHLFADARYILWVNGEYVERGPARFQPNGPEYDSVDLGNHLKSGRNAIALIVVANLSGGKVMRHLPGLTALLQVDGKEVSRTDSSWKWTDKTRYRKVTASWANLGDVQVDARVEDGDWTLPDYVDEAWHASVSIDGRGWGVLTARRIPPLHETPVPIVFANNITLPATLTAGQKLEFSASRIVQAYALMELSADAGTELSLEPYGLKYVAKAGQQSHFTLDTRGLMRGSLEVTKGKATITAFKLLERLYPYDRLGSFKSSDPFLDRLWEMCARSCEVLSEDSYVDCADRERVEWMDDDPPGFDITRTAMAGPGGAGAGPVFSDPRLLGEMVRRTALTLQPDGWVKAHTCSDRYDIHAKMEDRACDWVSGIRRYYDATSDAERVREIWPAVTAQMDYFLKRRSDRGLVSARDWVVWGNPLGYITGQTTTLNAFVCRALFDSAFLAEAIGEKGDSERFSKAADDLKKAINASLWDEKRGDYFSGYFSEADLAATGDSKRKLSLPLTDGLTPTTLHADVFALDREVVPAERRDRVTASMLKQLPAPGRLGSAIMVYYYVFKQLYALDRPDCDAQVFSMLRIGWKPMVESPLDCSWEGFRGGSHAHIYGMYPGYFLSAYVLGVRRDAPVAERKIRIEPHLGDLTEAQGVVVTEFGPVAVSWKKDGGWMQFQITAPDNVETTLALPSLPGRDTVQIDGKETKGAVHGSRLELQLTAGQHRGALETQSHLLQN
jgi:alpha-L-rhamnosidase